MSGAQGKLVIMKLFFYSFRIERTVYVSAEQKDLEDGNADLTDDVIIWELEKQPRIFPVEDMRGSLIIKL